MIKLNNISAGYDGKVQLSGVTLSIPDTGLTLIVGPNGGGKTTMLRVILGLLPTMEGSVEYFRNGTKVGGLSMGYLPQYNSIDRQFPISVMDVVLSGLDCKRGLLGRIKPGYITMAKEALETTETLHLKDRPIKALSGGELQRILLSRAIVSHPEVIILDEPDTYLDGRFSPNMYKIVQELSHSCAVILSSHNADNLAAYAKATVLVDEKVTILN